jgi:SAM-dependent methyltransferase
MFIESIFTSSSILREEPLFAKGAFDLVVMDTALHLIPDCDKALAETARVLKHSGAFVCSIPTLGIRCPIRANPPGSISIPPTIIIPHLKIPQAYDIFVG